MTFVTPGFYNYINFIVNDLFLNLTGSHKKLILDGTKEIIDTIAKYFRFTQPYDKYYYQFKQNNNRDIIALINLLLPFIESHDNFKLYKEIRSLNDLYIGKKSGQANPWENNYKYSNIQFNRFKKIPDPARPNEDIIEEDQFKEEYLCHNKELLKHTIRTIANKLYVNWVNIRPIVNYKNWDLYDNTYIDKSVKTRNISEDINYNGLYIGDIYNTIINTLFRSILEIKWVLYNRLENGQPVAFIKTLSDHFPLQDIVNKKKWFEVDQTLYINSWNNLTNQTGDKTIKDLVYYILLFFERSYGVEANKRNKEYTILQKNVDEDEKEDQDYQNITEEKVLSNKDKVDVELIYNFLYGVIHKLKKTWYGSQIYKDDEFQSGKLNNAPNEYATLKDVYNFAKSIHMYGSKKEKKFYQPYWDSLSKDQQDNFIEKINNNNTKWFNISGILRKLYGDDNHQQNIFNYIHTNIIDIVFDALYQRGMLSEFIPEPELTDEDILPKGYFQKKEALKTKMKDIVFDNSYEDSKYNKVPYFITFDTYGNLPKIKLEEKKKLVEKTYFETLAEDHDWYGIYAMDWISQINFFHHYINNRIIYVTGSTGVGKSSQVPKLLLYALKMINFNDEGKIICSQPRIAPTVNNATTISSQMGIPILEYNQKHDKQLHTFSGAIQYQYKRDKHVVLDDQYYLKMVTDGLLLEDVVANPLLKREAETMKKDKKIYRLRNKYDIVIVDESHEHNGNMDLILTLARNSLYYNNSLKLVIISATIDADEPIYRRYYREIDDNMMYPLSRVILKDNELKYDRQNVDRRFHISPPGLTTLYKVQDFYLDKDTDSYEEAAKKGIEKVLEICRTPTSGDLLFFSSGIKEIKKICYELNDKLPKDVICVPYHGKISNDWKVKIENIGKQISSIKIDKDKLYDVISGYLSPEDVKFIEDAYRGVEYTRAVIVATNAAEASITVTSLRYVVDTGYSIVVAYDYTRDAVVPSVNKITEASRVQRRGRIGRVADGDVYYMYARGARARVRQPYNICISDVHENIYKLLSKSYKENLLLPSEIDVNTYLPYRNDNGTDLLNAVPSNNGYKNIIEKQYILDNKIYSNIIYKNNKDYNSALAKYGFKTGYDTDTLFDEQGEFYLIHPSENEITRELLTGQVITIVKDENKNDIVNKIKIDKNKIMLFLRKLQDKLMIVDHIIKKNNIQQNIHVPIEYQFVKTKFGEEISKIALDMNIFYNNAIALYYGTKLDCAEEVLTVATMLRTREDQQKYDLISWYTMYEGYRGKKLYHSKEFHDNFSNGESDFLALLEIFNRFKAEHKDWELFKDYKKDLAQFSDYKGEYINNKYEETPNMDIDIFEKFKKYDRENNFSEKEFLSDNPRGHIIKEELLKKKDIIEKWCDDNYVNFNKMRDFLNMYQYNYYKYKSKLLEKDAFDLKIEPYKIYDNKIDNIKYSFIYGNGGNIINSLSPGFYTTIDTFTDYVMYFKSVLDTRFDTTTYGLITNVNLNDVANSLPHIYSPILLGDSDLKKDVINKFNNNNLYTMISKMGDDTIKDYYKILASNYNSQSGGFNKTKIIKLDTKSILHDRYSEISKLVKDRSLLQYYENVYILKERGTIRGIFLIDVITNSVHVTPIYVKSNEYKQLFKNKINQNYKVRFII
jgi:HrpA-like RNA helicase